MVDVITIAAFFWLLFTAYYAVMELMRGLHDSVLFLYVLHFCLCGAPLLLDALFGTPIYAFLPGYRECARDDTTKIIYAVYVSAVPLVWQFTARRRVAPGPLRQGGFSRMILNVHSFAYIGVMALPLVLVPFAPDPMLHIAYGSVTGDDLADDVLSYWSIVALACLLSVMAAMAVLLRARRVGAATIALVVPLLTAACWFHGKRGIVLIALSGLLYVGLARKFLIGFRLLAAGALAAAFMAVFSYAYQSNVRSSQLIYDKFDAVYENIRVDYGRDSVIKFTLYSELYPEQGRILEYRGQSLLFVLAMYVPRSMMPGKPWPYPYYVTSAIFGLPPASIVTWSVTTSWLEEAIANFGWAGLLVGPLVLSLVCRLGDATEDVLTHALTVLIGGLMLALPISAFGPLAILWLGAIVACRATRDRGAVGPPAERHVSEPREVRGQLVGALPHLGDC